MALVLAVGYKCTRHSCVCAVVVVLDSKETVRPPALPVCVDWLQDDVAALAGRKPERRQEDWESKRVFFCTADVSQAFGAQSWGQSWVVGVVACHVQPCWALAVSQPQRQPSAESITCMSSGQPILSACMHDASPLQVIPVSK